MPTLHLLILALIQGITEFLPISSSAHLVLLPKVTGWQDQGLVIDVAVHVGTLGAVIVYFWRDVWWMILGVFKALTGRLTLPGLLAMKVVVATMPAIAAGYALHELASGSLRSAELIAWTTIVFGILLWIADKFMLSVRKIDHIGWGDAILIGLAQAIALIPGVSRSGITMTAARALGFERKEAARFSLLLSIPVILGAGALAGIDLHEQGDTALTADALLAAVLAFVSALLAIWGMMRWLERSSFTPFVLYRLLLGGGLLVWIYY